MERETTSSGDAVGTFLFDNEYCRIIEVMEAAGILANLSLTGQKGFTGAGGREYPVPSLEQLKVIFKENNETVERKMEQGFTQLQLTPVGMPLSQLIEIVKNTIIRHAAAGNILRTKKEPDQEDQPVRVNTGKPFWIWEKVSFAMDTGNIVYFPRAYTECDLHGFTKEEASHNDRICAVPGWSIGLIEPIAVMPREKQSVILGKRRQLEEYSMPEKYLETLKGQEYFGETGWTLEDFFTHFLVRLETTGQISHDRDDNNALWLLASYMPYSGAYMRQLVIVGYWARTTGRIEISAHRSRNRLKGWVARSIVRLGS